MTRLRGFTLLECLLALGILAIIAHWASYSYQYLLFKQAVSHDVALIESTLISSRQAALLNNESVTVMFRDQTLSIARQSLQLSGRTAIYLAFFPKSHDHSIRFTDDGLTAFQNGSIYVCPQQFSTRLAQRIVINQAGRVRVTGEGAAAGC